MTINADVAPLHRKNDYLDDIFSNEIGNINLPESLNGCVLHRYAQSVSHSLELRPATVFMQAMAAASAALSTSYCTTYKSGYRIPLGLYVVCEEAPGAGKTRCQSLFFDDYRREIAAINHELYEQNKKLKKDDTQKAYAFGILNDTTSAALSDKLASACSGRFVISSSEQSTFDSLFGGASGAKSYSNDNGILLNGYDGNYIESARVSRKSYSGHVWGTVAIFSQLGSISRVVKESNGTGLSERFIMVSEETNIGTRTFDNGCVGDADQAEYQRVIKAAMNPFRSAVTNPDEIQVTGIDVLAVIKPDAEGYRKLLSLKRDIEGRLGELIGGGELIMTQFMSKMEQHSLKFAAILYAYDELSVHGQIKSNTIPVDYVLKGTDLFKVLAGHYHQILKSDGEDGEAAEVSVVLNFMRGQRGLALEISEAAKSIARRSPFRKMRSAHKVAKSRILDMIRKGVIDSTQDDSGKVCVRLP